MKMKPSHKLKFLSNSPVIRAVAVGALFLSPVLPLDPFTDAALAQHEDGAGEEGSGGKGPGQPGGNPDPGGSGQGGGGHDGGEGDGHDGGEGGGRGGGHATDPDSEGTGPGAGQSDDQDTSGGRPVWAQRGIPDVELGRLSVVRSPDRVLDQAFTEALAGLTPEMISFYNLSLDEAIAALRADFGDLEIIDSPLQNLALLRDALDGNSALSSFGVTSSVNTLLPIFLGVASDKTLRVTPDVAWAVSYILGYELTAAQATVLAEQADAVRIAVLEGHG